MTTVSIDASQFSMNRYAVNIRVIPKGGTEKDTIKLDKSLVELRIVKDYEKQIYPYYRVSVALSAEQASALQKCWREAKLYITMRQRKVTGNRGDSREIDTLKDYLKDAEFQIMTMDGAPPPTVGNSNSQARAATAAIYHMELSSTVALSINKKLNNGSYHDVRVVDVIASLTVNNKPATKPYKFYMAASDNDRRYKSMMVPPLNYVQAIRYVDKVHGIYNGTLCVFLDVDGGYILGSTTTFTPFKDTDPTGVRLELLAPASGAPMVTAGSGYDSKSRMFRLRSAQRITVDVNGPARKETVGERIKLVRSSHSERSGSNCKNLFADLRTMADTAKERILWQKYDNPLIPARLKIAARESYSPAMMTFDSPDLSIFNPVMQWSLVTPEKTMSDFEGFWRLQAVEIILNKPANSIASCSSQVMARIIPATENPS